MHFNFELVLSLFLSLSVQTSPTTPSLFLTLYVCSCSILLSILWLPFIISFLFLLFLFIIILTFILSSRWLFLFTIKHISKSKKQRARLEVAAFLASHISVQYCTNQWRNLLKTRLMMMSDWFFPELLYRFTLYSLTIRQLNFIHDFEFVALD